MTELENKQQTQAEVAVPATFEELEVKVTPAIIGNHNETLVLDTQD
jgi:hypothetical protein